MMITVIMVMIRDESNDNDLNKTHDDKMNYEEKRNNENIKNGNARDPTKNVPRSAGAGELIKGEAHHYTC